MSTTNDKTSTLIFLRKENEILLAMKKRGFGEGLWNGVGGTIEASESIEQSLAREAREEIGVTPMKYTQVAEHDFIQDADTDHPWHMYVYVYFCDEWEGEPTESEEMAPQWFSLDEIPYEKMWSADEIWLPRVLSGDKVTGMFTMNSRLEVLSHSVLTHDRLPLEAAETN